MDKENFERLMYLQQGFFKKNDYIFAKSCVDFNEDDFLKLTTTENLLEVSTEAFKFGILMSAQNGHIDLIKHFTENNNLYKRLYNLNISNVIAIAADRGHLEILKRLTDQKLNLDFDIHYKNDLALQYAVDSKRYDIVRYLLTSNELDENADPSSKSHAAFKIAALRNDKEMLDIFIIEAKMAFTDDLLKFAQECKLDNLALTISSALILNKFLNHKKQKHNIENKTINSKIKP